MRLPTLRPLCLALLLVACCMPLAMAQPATPDFSGAWRLDDQHSDGADALMSRLRGEARREQPAPQPSTAHPTASSGSTGSGGRHGGGMGHGGMGGGGMGGGHGGHRGSGNRTTKAASTDQDPLAHEQFALPPLLQTDSVLLVQQQTGSVKIQLDNGEWLDVTLDGQVRQSLNGDAMVQGQAYDNGVRITIVFADGSRLEQDWIRSGDGRQLTIYGQWKLPSLQKPVPFRRSYLAVG